MYIYKCVIISGYFQLCEDQTVHGHVSGDQWVENEKLKTIAIFVLEIRT